jgi:hypothetical protein
MNVVDRDTAALDIERWLDQKQIGSRKRESKKDDIENLIFEVIDGNLVVEDDCSLRYKLKFPIIDKNGSVVVDELKFKARVCDQEIQSYLKGVKASDAFGIVRAYICALTNTSAGIISKLDTEDKSVADAVALFFM